MKLSVFYRGEVAFQEAEFRDQGRYAWIARAGGERRQLRIVGS